MDKSAQGRAQIDHLLAQPQLAALLAELLSTQYDRADEINLTIHHGDQMLDHSLQHHQHAAIALSQYFQISLQQLHCFSQVVERCFSRPLSQLRVLDFACGYGRLLRLLSSVAPDGQFTGAEIQTSALCFCRDQFRVQTIPSHPNPAAFAVEEPFDVIWVASLFSHLPDELFKQWFSRLMECLRPNGLLAFSVRGIELLDEGSTVDESLIYQTKSELTVLDADIYGTTYAGQGHVKQVIEDTLGPGHGYLRLPRALAYEQDLYLVARNPDHDWRKLATFSRGPWGWVDRMQWQDGKLLVQGWAFVDTGFPVEVELRSGEKTHRVECSVARPDVAAVLGMPAIHSGWEARIPAEESWLEVLVHGEQQSVGLLYFGPIPAND